MAEPAAVDRPGPVRSPSLVQRGMARLRDAFFGPGVPLPVSAPAGTEPRRYAYRPQQNRTTTNRLDERLSAGQLRALAENCDLVANAIDTRIQQMARLRWTITPREKGGNTAGLDEITERFRRPDRVNRWKPWFKAGLYDLLTLDAWPIYASPNAVGGVYALESIDPALVNICIDAKGREPVDPEAVAYQQVVNGVVHFSFTRANMVYARLNPRTHKLYGYSPVERVHVIVNLAIRRLASQLHYYTDGTVPEAIVTTPKEWPANMVAEFQTYWDSLFEGDQAIRRRMRFVPGGDGMNVHWSKDAVLKDEMDEWLARVVAYAFSLPPTWAVRQMNRATAEAAQDAAIQEGQLPFMEDLADVFDDVLERFWQRPDAQFTWRDPRQPDPVKQSQVHNAYWSIGVLSTDDIREELGLDPVGLGPTILAGGVPVLVADIVAGLYEPVPVDDGGEDPGGGPDGDGGPADDPDDDEDDDTSGEEDSEQRPRGRKAVAGGLQKRRRTTVATLGAAAAKLRANRLRNSRPVRKAERKLARSVARVLKMLATDVAQQLAPVLEQWAAGPLRKDEATERAAQLAAELDLARLEVLIDPTQAVLDTVARAGAKQAVAALRVKVPDPDAFALPNDRVVAFAQQRAAELVGKRVLSDGSIIDNPNPKYAITDGTRDLVRGTITTALREGWTRAQMRDAMVDVYAFSPQRAVLVARTEVTRALAAGNAETWRESGIVSGKQWILGSEHDIDDLCDGNAEAGVIPLDALFPSGDDAEPGHPNCVCTTVPVLEAA